MRRARSGATPTGSKPIPIGLTAIEERLFQIGKLIRQHGGDVEAVLAANDRLIAEIESLAGAQRSARCSSAPRRRLCSTKAAAMARKLSSARKKAATLLGDAIGKELDALGMGRARVVVDVAPQRGGTDLDVEVRGSVATASIASSS